MMMMMLEFRMALHEWSGDDSARFYQLLKNKFRKMTPDQKKELEPVILNIFKYGSNAEKNKVALSLLQLKRQQQQ